jgi:4-amino-4-deoxy-L-arabinose transferase-like glycosyltransferase
LALHIPLSSSHSWNSLSRVERHKSTYLLLAVLGVAFWLRIWGISFGLPYDFTYDEVHEILRAFKLGAGEYDWQGFGKGGLYYLLFVEYGLLYIVWWITGHVDNTHEFALHYFQDPSMFYLLARLTVAVFGTLTCLVIFLIGREIYDLRVALGAAFIGATAYFHGLWSHYINVDIGMSLAIWASILAYLQYEKKEQLRWLIGAGALGGIAIAHKMPGGIVLLPLFMAIATRPTRQRSLYQMLKEASVILLVLLGTLTLVAPEWLINFHFGMLFGQFSRLFGGQGGVAINLDSSDFDNAVDLVTIMGEDRTQYFKLLLKDYNLVLTLSAILGIVYGLWQRHRWDIIWSVFSVVFLCIMLFADRGQAERYLLPIIPALWLLGSRIVAVVLGRYWWSTAAGLVCIIAIPLMALVRQNYVWTKPDTRVLAKEWIEANIPAGSKILMDGMRYRFVPSPPLNPDKNTVVHRIEEMQKAKRVSRGVSDKTLTLYSEAMARLQGPTYEIHSTEYGLNVEELPNYVQACFDYIITSSSISRKYTDQLNRTRFPKSAQFYEQLKTDSQFRAVYTVQPSLWLNDGPIITVYKVFSSCEVAPPHSSNQQRTSLLNK